MPATITAENQMNENQLDRILSVTEIAQYMGISRSKAFQLVHSEGLKKLRLGRRILVRESDLNNWIEEQINSADNELKEGNRL